jgi:hypothetical protein
MPRYVYQFLVIGFCNHRICNRYCHQPPNQSVAGSPVHYVATASTTTCAKSVASMGIYINNVLTYVVDQPSLSTELTLNPGTYQTVVEEWDYCGGASYTPVNITITAATGVWVNSPTNDAPVGSPVHYLATATTSACSKGVASMGVYINNVLSYVQNGASLSANLSFSPGTYHTVVEEWDYCGGAAYTPINITVAGNIMSNLQASGGWIGYGELAPAYNICRQCGPAVTWSMEQHVPSPSLNTNATRFNIGGATSYSDVLWTNALIGQNSSQGLPDSNHALLPTLHNFVYDAYFYSSQLSLSQALEFDISMYWNGLSQIWGQQCRIAGGNEWDIWDNVNAKWVPTGVSCYPNNNGWNHVTIQVERESDNWLLFKSITLNGVTNTINQYYAPGSAPPGWWGITINFQMDGNEQQAAYSAYVDDLDFTYW